MRRATSCSLSPCRIRPLFLSTLSLRRATLRKLRNPSRPGNFYPRSPCGERQQTKALKVATLCISIHALLAESDFLFLILLLFGLKISIHALLAESDIASTASVATLDDFYPRSPCGERPCSLSLCLIRPLFLSTLSLRRATPSLYQLYDTYAISIHALLAESDPAAGYAG